MLVYINEIKRISNGFMPIISCFSPEIPDQNWFNQSIYDAKGKSIIIG